MFASVKSSRGDSLRFSSRLQICRWMRQLPTKFQLAEEFAAATGTPQTPEQVAQGFLTFAVVNTTPIKQVSVQKGHHGHTLRVAVLRPCWRRSSLTRWDGNGVHPSVAGASSVYGMGLATTAVLREQAVEIALNEAGLAGVETWACHAGARPSGNCETRDDRAHIVTRAPRPRGTALEVPIRDHGDGGMSAATHRGTKFGSTTGKS